ncbi:YhgE/Pip family protein [Microbacterium sp. NPDC096154]|uniref:YhgE/Pip domain-containing protein n=1 Tax=Microbacterium sp. NPDC096154 TaxID=3155549 RepID=UPI003323160C
MTRFRSLAVAGIERARSAKPVTWLTVVGVLLLPALVGGVLVAALYNPTDRLDNMTAAIVNLDEPVTIQDQYTPLGRQLAAGLVEGSDDIGSNLTWVLSNEEDAAEGIQDGTYQAVITIPEEFSAAATSSGQKLSGEDEEPQQATIEVLTAPDARLADEAITSQIASVATSSMGRMLSEATLSNILVGYTTLGEQLGEAADGAAQLADGAGEARNGADELANGASQLGTGAGELASGAGQLAGGAGQLAGGASELSGGAAALADGVSGLGGGASELADGATRLSSGVRDLAAGLAGDGSAENPGLAPSLHGVADGADQLATQLSTGASTIETQGLVPTELTGGAASVASGLDALSRNCAFSGAGAEFCQQLAALATGAAGTSGGLSQLATQLPAEIAGQLRAAAGGAGTLADGAGRLAAGADTAAAGASQLADGAGELADGATQLSQGAGQLGAGASQLSQGASELATGADGVATGTAQLASGAGELSTGAGQLATGTSQLGDGIGELSTGTRSLADGLNQATEQIPSYTEREAEDLATVISDPVTASAGDDVSLFGASAVPLLAAVVLWFGALATFVVMRSVTARALTSRRASVLLAGGALLPAAAIGAVQGLLVGIVIQIVGGYEPGTAGALFALCTLIGVAFAAVHQALGAVLGGAGRWLAALIGAAALATGIVSTLPGWLAELADILPTSPAYRSLLGVVTDAGGTGGAITALLVWAALCFVATTLAVARRRTISSKALLAETPA